MSPMAGGGEASLTQGPSKRYPAKRNATKAAAADTGPHGASSTGRSSSTKRKAAKGPASYRTPRPRASGRNSDEELETAAAGEPKNRLPKEDIDWILSQKPTAPPARYAALKRENPELTPRPGEEADEDKMRLYRLAKNFYEMEERLPREQARLRGELERKGYVELDDETVRRRAEVQAVIDREWPEIEAMTKELVVAEKEYRRSQGCEVSDSDDDEGEGCDESDDSD
ncbi:unnamed protein product [Urochloa humidicola]